MKNKSVTKCVIIGKSIKNLLISCLRFIIFGREDYGKNHNETEKSRKKRYILEFVYTAIFMVVVVLFTVHMLVVFFVIN